MAEIVVTKVVVSEMMVFAIKVLVSRTLVENQYMIMNLVTMPWFLANSAERRALKVYLLINNFCV